MNNNDFNLIIADSLQRIIENNTPLWKQNEVLRKRFVRDYPVDKISSFEFDEYVLGKGACNKSFCYRIERELDGLGRITGSSVNRFGVWYSKSSGNYDCSVKWGGIHKDVSQAFAEIKKNIVDLIDAGKSEDRARIIRNELSPMFKGKILFIYYPELYFPVYSHLHLKHFINSLNLSVMSNNEFDLQKTLLEARCNWPALDDNSPYLWPDLLYDIFKAPSRSSFQDVPPLNEAINGANFITSLSASTNEGLNGQSRGKSKLNFEKINRQRKWLGDRGEKIVLALEKKRLTEAGLSLLANRVEHVASEDDSAGYDIKSFEEDGAERYIEVKATRADNLSRGFYLSRNELRVSIEKSNYYVYIVFKADTGTPDIYSIDKPDFENQAEYSLEPQTYNVKIDF
ncbi:DUF3883 domain-containing protein [Maridesulfovibrio sp. FT414]|uniref:DUF3883 domain-containing protein n=1 Tax=Maridesulfovibrio sp. FT414 TaxID=2979469 RepID=UPI003D802614